MDNLALVLSLLGQFNLDVPECRVKAQFVIAPEKASPCGLVRTTKEVRPAHACADLSAKRIYLRAEWWETATYAQQRKVVYHELGHLCGLNHDWSRANIMDSDLTTADLPWEALVQDLRRRVKEKK